LVKALLKTLLPAHLVRAAQETRDMVRLGTTGRKAFNAAPLRSANEIDLAKLFRNDNTAAAWEADHALIKGVFGHDNRPGGVNPGDRRAVYYLIHSLKPESVLEVGTHIGASTIYIARALKSGGSRGKVTTVDILDVNDPAEGPWKGAGLKMAPRDFARQADCLDAIEFVRSGSINYLREAERKFDFIFLDGDHRAHTVYDEMAAALNILKPGGLILLHDYYPGAKALFADGDMIGGPFRALARIARENPAIKVQPLGDLPWPTKEKSHATSLALVMR
jgi:predicted O-methyltransferase YrrM